MLQEVDIRSKRNYYTPQFDRIAGLKPGYASFFAVNYSSPWVPIPVFQPWKAYGGVYSGVATYSRIQPTKSTRYQLPGAFDWPTRIFQLDRCVAEHRLSLPNGRELVLYNIHNSAHDKDGALKHQELAFLRELFLKEYDKGNFVIAGGDWNQCPPGIEFDIFMPGRTQGYHQLNIDPDFLPLDWQWTYDLKTPSNRKTKLPYRSGETFETLIDFFLVSPNVLVKEVKCSDLNFQYSDHQPVKMTVALRW
jgi:endonuclease/exonuclease/phosphatase family metal-dependent hydrolase